MKAIRRSSAVRSLFSVPAPEARFHDLLDPVVRRAAQGDHEAIETVYRQLRTRLVGAARTHRLEGCDAEDVVQDLFVILLEARLHPPRANDPAVPWLFRMVDVLAQGRAAR